jgi:hypothetical protein
LTLRLILRRIKMKKYIDRDALAEYAHSEYGILTASEIMQFPTADVQLVKHGRWMYPFYCSECGFTPYYSSDLTYNYCPNCGCKQDLEGGDING